MIQNDKSFCINQIDLWSFLVLLYVKSDNAFPWVSAHISGFNIGAPIGYKLRAIPAIHEINALREVLWQQLGKFLLKSIIALWVLRLIEYKSISLILVLARIVLMLTIITVSLLIHYFWRLTVVTKVIGQSTSKACVPPTALQYTSRCFTEKHHESNFAK